jgi:outer membrane lipoprotein SlyB
MKNKFVLTEEESKRILSLHKKKIAEERQEVDELDTDLGGWTAAGAGGGAAAGAGVGFMVGGPAGAAIGAVIGAVGGSIVGYVANADGNPQQIVKKTLVKCRTDKKMFTKPTKSKARLQAIAGDIRKALSGWGWTNLEDLQRAISSCDTLVDFCNVSYIYYNINGETLFTALDGDLDANEEWTKYVLVPLKRLAKNTKVIPPTPVKTDCKDIIKSFTDDGYTQITLERYRELEGDKTRIRKYKYCPATNKNLHFAKLTGTQTGPPKPTPIVTGGGGGDNNNNNTNQQDVPQDVDVINPFGQGGEQEVQRITVDDKIYSEL